MDRRYDFYYAACRDTAEQPFVPPEGSVRACLVLCGNIMNFSHPQALDYLINLCERPWRYIFYVPSWAEFASFVYEDVLVYCRKLNDTLAPGRFFVLVDQLVALDEGRLCVAGSPLWPNIEVRTDRALSSPLLRRAGVDAPPVPVDLVWLAQRHQESLDFLLAAATKCHVVVTAVQPFALELPRHETQRLLQSDDVPLRRCLHACRAWFFPFSDEFRGPAKCSPDLLPPVAAETPFYGAARHPAVVPGSKRMGEAILVL